MVAKIILIIIGNLFLVASLGMIILKLLPAAFVCLFIGVGFGIKAILKYP